MRFLFALVFTLWVACNTVPPAPQDAGPTDGAVLPIDRTLQFLGAMPLTLGPGLGADVVVALRDRSGALIGGVPIRFGLLGNAYDATLSATTVSTGTDGTTLGLARVTFYAPTSAEATLRIQAVADRAPTAVLPVSVSARGFGTIGVTAQYTGPRAPTALAVDLFDATTCDAVNGAVSVRRADVPASGAVASFGGIPAQVPFAVQMAALGADGTPVAQGCIDGVTVDVGQVTGVTVPMTDVPLVGAGTYTAGLELDLGVSPPQAESAWVAAMATAVNSAGGSEAGFLIDGIAQAVQASSPETYASFVTTEPMLTATVATDFAARSGGPLSALTSLARDAAHAVQAVSAVATIDATGSGAVRAFVVTVDPLTPDVRSDDAVFSPGATSGTVSIALSTQDRAVVHLAGLPFGFPRVAQAAVGALLARLNATSSAEWAGLVTDCAHVATLVVGSTGACDATCVASACSTRVGALAAAFDASVASVGSAHTRIDVSFEGVATGRAASVHLATVAPSAMIGNFEDDPTLALFGTGQLSSP